MENKEHVPLLSFCDALILIILQISGAPEDIKKYSYKWKEDIKKDKKIFCKNIRNKLKIRKF